MVAHDRFLVRRRTVRSNNYGVPVPRVHEEGVGAVAEALPSLQHRSVEGQWLLQRTMVRRRC